MRKKGVREVAMLLLVTGVLLCGCGGGGSSSSGGGPSPSSPSGTVEGNAK